MYITYGSVCGTHGFLWMAFCHSLHTCVCLLCAWRQLHFGVCIGHFGVCKGLVYNVFHNSEILLFLKGCRNGNQLFYYVKICICITCCTKAALSFSPVLWVINPVRAVYKVSLQLLQERVERQEDFKGNIARLLGGKNGASSLMWGSNWSDIMRVPWKHVKIYGEEGSSIITK